MTPQYHVISSAVNFGHQSDWLILTIRGSRGYFGPQCFKVKTKCLHTTDHILEQKSLLDKVSVSDRGVDDIEMTMFLWNFLGIFIIFVQVASESLPLVHGFYVVDGFWSTLGADAGLHGDISARIKGGLGW